MKVGHFPFIGNGKAIAMGEPEGMVKTVFDAKTGELLGAHMVGAEVTEMIQGYTIARTLESTEAELMRHRVPASDAQRDDARGGAGGLWAGDPLLITDRRPGVRNARSPRSTKSGLLQPFEHMVSRLVRAELIGERPGI